MTVGISSDRTKHVTWWNVVFIAAIALAVRAAHLGSATPTYDEFYHLLAARGWLISGSFSIGDGYYDRAILFTRIVAESLRMFGDTMIAGRIPAMLAGTLWVVAVFVWTRRLAGAVAAWVAALLLALDPVAIHLSQWVRFYTLHGLLVWLGAACVYQLVTEPFRFRRAALLALFAGVSLAIATHLMATTLIAVGGLGAWAAAMLLPRLPALSSQRPELRWFLVLVGLVLVASVVWLITSGTAAGHWQVYRRVLPWSEPGTTGNRWYVYWLGSQYPVLWVLFPIAAVFAISRFTRLAIFALWMFGSAFVIISFGGSKADRYLYFAMPFFFLLWGLALATLLPALLSAAERGLETIAGRHLSPWLRRATAVALAAITILFAASQTGALRTSLRLVFPGGGERPYRMADWPLALSELRPLVDSADVVVSSYLLKPIYYLGRGDVTLSRTEVAELETMLGHPAEFTIDPSTGRPAISTPESLRRVMDCYESGVVLTEEYHLNRAILVTEETTAFLFANTTEFPMPPDSWVRAFRWRHSVSPEGAECPPWASSSAPRQAWTPESAPPR
jgi:4-amino-4-deoxy-L-arabinose transferase-like glycosyltransferase